MLVVQSCLTLCDSMNCSPPGSSVPGILQARILECVAMPSSRGSSRPRDQTCVSLSPALAGRFFTTNGTGSLHLTKNPVSRASVSRAGPTEAGKQRTHLSSLLGPAPLLGDVFVGEVARLSKQKLKIKSEFEFHFNLNFR